jgi:hypothetical protein
MGQAIDFLSTVRLIISLYDIPVAISEFVGVSALPLWSLGYYRVTFDITLQRSLGSLMRDTRTSVIAWANIKFDEHELNESVLYRVSVLYRGS